MKKKILSVSALLLIMGCCSCRGQSTMRVTIDVQDGALQYTVNSGPMAADGLDALLKEVAKLDADQVILVEPTSRVSASDLVSLLQLMREAGLHNVVIRTPAKRNGVQGRITMVIDLCIGKVYGEDCKGGHDGFETNVSAPIETGRGK